MPNPKKDEGKQDYLNRCTKELIGKEKRSPEQAYRLCNVYWDKSHNQRSVLTLVAPMKLEEGDEELQSFMITAYTGRPVKTWSGKVIFDVNGMKAKAKFPVLREHARDRIVGYSSKTWRDENHFFIKGNFAKNTKDADEVKSLAMEGFPWQASVGIWPEKIKTLESEKETFKVNGQEVNGPIEIWTESHVGEVSFVSLGADDETAAVVLSDDGEKVPITLEEGDVNLDFLPRMRKDKLEKGGSIMPKAVEVLESKDRMFKEAEVIAFLNTLGEDQFTDENREMILGSLKLMGAVKDQLPEKFVEKLVKAVPELKDVFTVTEVKEVKFPVDETKIRKEIEAELRKEMKMEKDVAVVKLEGVVETLGKELKITTTALDKEREIRELVEIKNFIKEKNVPGDIEKVSRTIFLAKKANAELGKDLEETLAATGAALTAAGVFNEVGKSTPGETGETAFERLQKMVTEVMEKDSNLPQEKAWEKVVKQNSELYKQYTAERSVAVKGVH